MLINKISLYLVSKPSGMSTKKKIEGFQEKINLTYQEKAVRFKKASIRVNLPNFQHGFS